MFINQLTWIIHYTFPESVFRFRYLEFAVKHGGCLHISAIKDLCCRDVETIV